MVRSDEMYDAALRLDDDKACDNIGVFAEHPKCACPRVIGLLASCFSGFFFHGSLPEAFISVIRVPVIQDYDKPF